MQPVPRTSILLVDDHPENLLTLEAILGGLGENLVRANSGQEALRCLLDQDFAVILLDVQMPDMDGFETAALIRSRARSCQTPIIFLTAFSTSDQLMFKGYSLGAVDYLHKPVDPGILTSKVTVFVELFKKTEALKQQAAQLTVANAQLQRSEEQFRSLSASSPVGIFVTDTQGHCTYMNPRCLALCQLTPANQDAGWLQAVHPDNRAAVVAEWNTYLQNHQDFLSEFQLQAGEVLRSVQVRSSPMLSDRGRPLGHVGTIEDISDRKQAEAARHQVIQEQVARREAEAANQMKDDFLAVLSHELRTPLNSMLGWSRLLRTRKFDQETIDRALETIERNANAQAQLIEDILDVSKIIRGKLRLSCGPTDLLSTVQAAVDAVRPSAEAKAIDLQFISPLEPNQSEPNQLEPNQTADPCEDSPAPEVLSFEPSSLEPSGLELPTFELSSLELPIPKFSVWGDPVRLQQIVWNLLSNAIKFTPEEGRVEVRLERDEANEASYAQLQVIDTGAGISAEFLPKVFDRFRQADSTTTRSHTGLGLGLAIVRHLVELHGGRVQAESAGEGQGATFTVALPLWKESRSQVKQIAPSPANLTNLRILVVDDEPDGRDLLTVMLQQYGAIAAAVASVSDALVAIDGFNPELLISDISMPREDGYMLIRKVRSLNSERSRQIPAIALTAHSREEDRQNALDAGFQAHLPKPVEAEALLRAIAQVTQPVSIGQPG